MRLELPLAPDEQKPSKAATVQEGQRNLTLFIRAPCMGRSAVHVLVIVRRQGDVQAFKKREAVLKPMQFAKECKNPSLHTTVATTVNQMLSYRALSLILKVS